MNRMKKLALVASMSVLSMTSLTLFAADELVEGYVANTTGTVWKSGYGDCVRDSYAVTTDKKTECGYQPEPVVMPSPEPIRVQAVMAPTAASITATQSEAIVINAAMLFGYDSAVLSDDARAVLNERIREYQGKAKLTEKMIVVGHTDSRGSEAYNQKLSEKRAQAVADYLKANTYVTATQIEAAGKGESEPVASNMYEDGRAQNRRVEIFLRGRSL
jgi:OOP family OmpA-OmpF porin